MKQTTYHAQLQDFEHAPQAKPCANNQPKHVFDKLPAGSNDIFSYHVLLKLSAKSNKAPHTPAHLCKGRSLQSMHAHHISYSSFAARRACTSHFLLSIIFTTSADPNEPNPVNKLYMFISYHLLMKTNKHTNATPQTLYLLHTTQKLRTTTLCLSNVMALRASDRPAKKAVKSKDAKKPMFTYIHDMHQTAPPTTSSWVPRCHASTSHIYSCNYISWRVSTMKPDASHCASCHSSV